MSEEDIDIYQDLPNFDEYGSANQREFEERIIGLNKQLENEKQKNKNLVTSLSSLLKTAKNEIARKDRTIDDLRESLNNFQFRRNNKQRTHKIDTIDPVRPTEEIKLEWNFKESKPPPINSIPISTLYSQRWQQKITNEMLSPKKEPEERYRPNTKDNYYYNRKRSRSPNYRRRGYSPRDSRHGSRRRDRSYSRDRKRYERPRHRREYSNTRHKSIIKVETNDEKLKIPPKSTVKEEEISLHLSVNVSHRCTSPADIKLKCDNEKQVVVEKHCSKKILTARRRRPIKLTDSNASMIIVVDNEIVNNNLCENK